MLKNENVFDPLNVQIQIRKNVISGHERVLIDASRFKKTGAIEKNNYAVVEMENLK